MALSSVFVKSRHLRWYHWLFAGLVLVYVTYIAASYLYLPGKLKHVVQKNIAELIGHPIDVGQITFNPFSISLTVTEFAIDDKPDQPIMAWQELYVNFSFWRSLFKWEVALETLFSKSSHINIEKRTEGFNFSDILERFASEEKDSPSEKSGIALEIQTIAIEKGSFHFIDLSGKKPATSILDNINLQFQDLYLATGDEKLNPFDVEASMPGGGTLHINGNYRIDPLYFEAKVQGADIQLAAYSEFLENVIPATVKNGLFSMEAGVFITRQNEIQVELKNGTIAVLDLAIDDAVMDPPMLRAKALHVEGLSLNLEKRNVLVEQVSYDGITAHQWLDEKGIPRFQSLLVQEIKKENIQMDTQPQGTGNLSEGDNIPWDILVKRFLITDSRVYFADKRPSFDAYHDLERINAVIENLTFTPGKNTTLSVSSMLNEKGTVEVTGDLILVPFSANLNYQVQELDLAGFSKYVEASSHMRLAGGDLNLKGKIHMTTEGGFPMQIGLKASVNNFHGQDLRNGRSLLKFQQLKVDELLLDTKQQNLSIKDVELITPELFLEMSKDKQLNFATLPKAPLSEPSTQGNREKAKGDGEQETPWNVRISEIKMQQGTIHLRDDSVAPTFEAGLYSMNMRINNLTDSGDKNALFELDSRVDRYAPFQIKGTLSPLAQQPNFTFEGQLEGLEMPPLSSYSGTYIGYSLHSGRLTLNLNYELKDRKLKGLNNIVADQLYLGEAVQSDQAIKAPVHLGLALLRDSEGVINLDVGVQGGLDDPGFSVAGIVMKAIVNVLSKAAAAPFKMLGSLVGSRKDLGKVEFAAGEVALNEENQERLRQLAGALKKRPKLVVVVQGNSSFEADKKAMQQQAVMTQVATARNVPFTVNNPVDWLLESQNRSELRKINKALALKSESDRKSEIRAVEPHLIDEALTQKTYYQMFKDVSEKQTISEQALTALADQRALSIKQFLIESGQLDSNRISMKKANPGVLTGLITRLGLEAR